MGRPPQTRGGGDVHDHAAARPHRSDRIVDREHRATQVQVECPRPVRNRRIWEDRLLVAAGIVHEDVKAAELPRGMIDHPLHVTLARNVGGDERGGCAVRPDRLNDRMPQRLIHIGNDHGGTFTRQPHRDLTTDPARGPCHKCRLARDHHAREPTQIRRRAPIARTSLPRSLWQSRIRFTASDEQGGALRREHACSG